MDRVKKLREFLNERPETTIAVVSHGMFLRSFVSDVSRRRFQNCECVRVMLDEDGNISDV